MLRRDWKQLHQNMQNDKAKNVIYYVCASCVNDTQRTKAVIFIYIIYTSTCEQ